jgi:hypothetical protein
MTAADGVEPEVQEVEETEEALSTWLLSSLCSDAQR